MNRFKEFTMQELAILGTGIAMAGTLGGLETEAFPLLQELNDELEARKVARNN